MYHLFAIVHCFPLHVSLSFPDRRKIDKINLYQRNLLCLNDFGLKLLSSLANRVRMCFTFAVFHYKLSEVKKMYATLVFFSILNLKWAECTQIHCLIDCADIQCPCAPLHGVYTAVSILINLLPHCPKY